MASCTFCSFVVSLLMLVASLTLTIVAILTDYWFVVESDGTVSEQQRKQNTYNFGFWRRCYDEVPDNIPRRDLSGTNNDCVTIYKDLIPDSDVDLSDNEELALHLSRSYIGLAITSGAAQLATIIIMLCGSWPGDCKRIKKPTLYICSTVVLIIATMAGIAGGVCFIAARDVEEKDLDMYQQMDTDFGWSFMLHWIGTGLCLVNGFIILCMLQFSYDESDDLVKYYSTM